jgi:ligand-binding sensor domain-containing protein
MGEGLPSIQLTAVAVDEASRLWVGTEDEGLGYPGSRLGEWGGVSFGLPGKHITALAARSDTLWVGTKNGLALWDSGFNESIRVYSTGHGLPSDTITVLSVCAGRLWCGTARGLAYFDPGGVPWEMSNPAGTPEWIYDVEVCGDSVVASSRSGVYVWDGVSWSDLAFSGDSVRCVVLFDGLVWAGTFDGGVYRQSPGGWEEVATGFFSPGVVDLRPRGATLWAATLKGLHSLAAGSDEWAWHYAPGPTSSELKDVFVDDSSTVWVAARRSAMVFDGTTWVRWDYRNTSGGIHTSDLSAVFVGEPDKPWFGHCCCLDTVGAACRTDRLVGLDRRGPWQAYPLYNIKTIVRDPLGDMWFGSDGIGLYRLRASDSSIVKHDADVSSDQIWTVEPRGAAEVWFGNAFQGVDILVRGGTPGLPSETWEHLDVLDTLASNFVTALSYDGEHMWVGTSGGVFVFQAATRSYLKHFGAAQGLTSDAIRDIEAYGVGAAWIATDMGVDHLCLDGNHFSLDTSDGIASLPVVSLDVDPAEDVLWVACHEGMNKIDLQSICRSLSKVYVYPNPWNSAESGGSGVSFGGLSGIGSGEIFTVDGIEVFAFENVSNGEEFFWGSDTEGTPLPSGVYLVRLRVSGATFTCKLAIVR